MSETKDPYSLNLYDVEFASTQGYSGRAIVLAVDKDEAKDVTKKELEGGGYVTTSSDVYDILDINIKNEMCINESKSIIMGVM